MTEPARAAFKHQEIAFSLCMGGLAVLARDNPDYSPHLLWAFAGLLGFNLAYHLALRRRGETWYVPMISMAVNTVLVTAVLFLSGADDSPFWPLYLVPIFTACLYLERRHVAFAAVTSAAFLATLSLYTGEPGEEPRWTFAEYAIKLTVLGTSALITAQYAFRERKARHELASTRAELANLAAEMENRESGRLETAGGLARFMAGLIYDLNGRLTLIRGRAELLRDALGGDTPAAEDAREIALSARALGRLGSDLLRVLKRGDEDSSVCDLPPLIDQVLNLIEHRLSRRKLVLNREIDGGLPPVRIGAPHLQQALLELLDAALENASTETAISASAKPHEGEVQIRLAFEAEDGFAPPPPVAQRRLLEPFGADVEVLGLGRSCAYLVRLPLGATVPRAAAR